MPKLNIMHLLHTMDHQFSFNIFFISYLTLFQVIKAHEIADDEKCCTTLT